MIKREPQLAPRFHILIFTYFAPRFSLNSSVNLFNKHALCSRFLTAKESIIALLAVVQWIEPQPEN